MALSLQPTMLQTFWFFYWHALIILGRQFGPTNPFTQINPFGVQSPFFPFPTPVYEYGACVLEPRGSGYNTRGIIRFRQQANSYVS